MFWVKLGYLVISLSLLLAVACSGSESTVDKSVEGASNSTLDETAIIIDIEGRMEVAFRQLWSEQQNAEQFVLDYWTPDAVAIASDGPTAWSGHGELVPLLEEFMAAYPRITAEPVYTQVVGENMAYQFARFMFYPAGPEGEPVPAKSLYVWLKHSGQWKIAADHFSYTRMDTPAVAR